MKNKRNQGITLIALVVTIIVLLILAGISIQMISGNNGILSRAEEAKQATEETQIIEEARIDILSVFSTKQSGLLSEDELRSILDPKFGTVSVTEGKNIKEETLTTTDGKFIIPVSKIYNGILTTGTIQTIADADEKDYYGQFIDYDVDLDGTLNDYDWKIFYNDGTNIYIIAEDYVPMAKCSLVTNSSTGREEDNSKPYSLYWYWNQIQNNGSADLFNNNVPNKTLHFANNFLKKWKTALGNNSTTNPNAKFVATIMNTNLWENFATSTKVNSLTSLDGELSAIGSPTLEMWVESWNTKYESEIELVLVSDAIGYWVGDVHESDWWLRARDISDTLYYPQNSSVDNCEGYWLASPGDYSDGTYVAAVHFSGAIGFCEYYLRYDGFTSDRMGVRPVVCLPSDITAIWNETDGVWNITKK